VISAPGRQPRSAATGICGLMRTRRRRESLIGLWSTREGAVCYRRHCRRGAAVTTRSQTMKGSAVITA